MSSSDQFFSQRNEGVLQRALYSDICRRLGGDLNEKQAGRLMKTVKHYMSEVHRVRGDDASIAIMNREVLQVVLPDYMMYMERQTLTSSRSAVSDIEIGPASGPVVVSGVIEDAGQGQGQGQSRQQMDVGAAFSQLQTARQNAGKRAAPDMPEFRLSLSDEPVVSMDTFERMKRDREGEAARASLEQASAAAASSTASVNPYVQASDSFLRDRRRADEDSEKAFADRERAQLEQRASQAAATQGQLPMPPDMRSLFFGDRQTLSRTLNQSAGDPSLVPRGRDSDSRQQMIITREPSSIEYKENELNLFVYSGDRDWISNSSETRYSFSILFDPGNMPTGLRLSPTSTVKFKNIVRIELVKAIMPGESVDSLITRSYSSGYTYTNAYNFNVLSFPYIQVRIPELDNNIYGTNQGLNASFGVLQYDANWIYDTNNSSARGYFAMIPKFLKCQKVYSPTPLATLQRLSFFFERPDGTPISSVTDTLDINYIYSSKEITATSATPTFIYGYDANNEYETSSAYYLLQTTTYFNQMTVTRGDRIQIANLAWTVAAAGGNAAQAQDFLTYIQQSGGLLVADVGYSSTSLTSGPSGGVPNIIIGANSTGYCNYIIVRGKFVDPTTGNTSTATLGNIQDLTIGTTPVSGSFTAFLSGNKLTSGRLINQSHQVQVALRVITREMDATSVLRPDNL